MCVTAHIPVSPLAFLRAVLDKDGDGTLSRQEFANALLQEPMLFECFVRTLAIPGLNGEIKAEFRDLRRRMCPKLRLSQLKLLWKTEAQRVVRAVQAQQGGDDGAGASPASQLLLSRAASVKLGPGGTPLCSKVAFLKFMHDKFSFPKCACIRGACAQPLSSWWWCGVCVCVWCRRSVQAFP